MIADTKDGVLFDTEAANRAYYNHILEHFDKPAMTADQFVQYLIAGLTQGSIYGLVALGFSLTMIPIAEVTKLLAGRRRRRLARRNER